MARVVVRFSFVSQAEHADSRRESTSTRMSGPGDWELSLRRGASLSIIGRKMKRKGGKGGQIVRLSTFCVADQGKNTDYVERERKKEKEERCPAAVMTRTDRKITWDRLRVRRTPLGQGGKGGKGKKKEKRSRRGPRTVGGRALPLSGS